MESNERVIARFYEAFAKRDAAGMIACYDPAVQFSDPVFPDLRGERAGAMWRMLCARGKDLRIECRDVRADATGGSAHWDAWYTFSRTGRAVHNSVDASFEFRDGRIVRHTDRFDLHRWAAQALGLPGRLLGGTAFLQKRIRAMAAQGLDAYLIKGAAAG